MHRRRSRFGSSRSSRRLVAPLLLSLTLTALAPSEAVGGPVGFNAFGGFYSGGADEAFVGGGLRFGLGGLNLVPNGEYLFVDHGTTYTLNADVTMNVLPLGAASGWVGAGLGLFTVDPDNGDSHTETVGNLLVGAGLSAVPLKPYGQIKYVIVDGDDPFVFTVGVRF